MIKALNTLNQDFYNVLEYNSIRGYAISLDFNSLSKTLNTQAYFSQSDINTSMIAIQLLNDKNPIILDESSIVYANIERADGTVVTNKCTIVDASIGAILISFSTLANEIAGTNMFEIVVRHAGNFKLVSPKVSYKIYDSIDYYYNEPTDEEVNVIDVLVDEVVSLKNTVINTNTIINEEMNERELIEQSRQESEAIRELQESARQSSILEIKEAEQVRVEKEIERQLSMDNMIETFTNKVSIVNNKVDIAEEKISQIDTRINEFDETIKPSHNIMITAEESREDNEKNRKLAEIERVEFYNTSKSDEAIRVSNEIKREDQENSRVESFESMVSTLDSKSQLADEKLSEISQKIEEASNKITQFSNDEVIRRVEHSSRINEFDNVIKTSHDAMVDAEGVRVQNEQNRISAENERVSLYNQVQLAEDERVASDINREQKIKEFEARIDQKISEYNTATLITVAEIDAIIANALK